MPPFNAAIFCGTKRRQYLARIGVENPQRPELVRLRRRRLTEEDPVRLSLTYSGIEDLERKAGNASQKI